MSAERLSDDPAFEQSQIWNAALEAEIETGRREESPRAARASLMVRLGRVTAGSVISLLGVILIPLPGPGLFVLAAGLSILAVDVPFARRLLQKVRARMPQDADGAIPNWLVALMGGAAGLSFAASAAVFLT